MARKDAKPATPAAPRRLFVRAILAVGIGLGLVGGIVALGSLAASVVGSSDRYRIPLTAIECNWPDWVDRETFFAEIRYLGDLPESFNVNDAGSVGHIRDAIAKHPWVEFVAGDGYLTVANRYPMTVGFRRPVLAVTTGEPTRVRTVDAKGILLPPHRPIPKLARFVGTVEPPGGPAGSPWNHPAVRRAAELAGLYESESIERTGTGWRIVRRDGTPLVVDR